MVRKKNTVGMDRKIEMKHPGALVPYASNARTHSDAQVAQIAASIREFGFTNPILTDGGDGVVAGHGRLLAARMLGLESVPTISLAGLTKAQIRAYVLADNKLAENAGWDDEMLAAELGDLQAEGASLDLSGFSELEIKHILQDSEIGAEVAPDETSGLCESWTILITCNSEHHQSELLERFGKEGLKCRALI